ncbi:MAG: PF20097 family protein [Planctomycetota bacterium]
MTPPHDTLRCPACHTQMQHGYLPVSDGLHFVRGDGKASNAFAEDLPGTHAVMRSNRLLAWRCKACQMVVFKYGRDNAKHIERITAIDDAAAESDSDPASAESED